MKAGVLLKKTAWIFVALGLLLVFILLDWLPTIKDLNRLRREQQDETLKIKKITAQASGFIFPDKEEKSLFARNKARLFRSLPKMRDHDGWLATAMLERQAQARAQGVDGARILFSHQALGGEFDPAAPGRPDPLADWISFHYREIQRGFEIVRDPRRFPWHGVFSALEPLPRQRLASGGMAVVLAAPLPALLDFINRISWGETRLEIVRLYLEPGASPPRAWLLCRGNYLAREPSRWKIMKETGGEGGGLLIDPDSPLLWRRVDPGIAGRPGKKELPPAGSPW
jgi:hypothetical protein